jgi:hypothetical protein
MHDPYSQIKNFHLFTLWHKDPEHRGDDDSCGWFVRSYHGNKEIFEKVVSEFRFNFDKNYWFTEDGTPIFSTPGIVLCMYRSAGWIIFNSDKTGSDSSWKKFNKFIKNHLHEILHFSENPTDSLHTAITREMYYRTIEHDRSKVESRDDRIRHFASVVYGDILRKIRPWYKHPRWHVHHWRVSVNWYNWWIIRDILYRRRMEQAKNVDQNLRDTV